MNVIVIQDQFETGGAARVTSVLCNELCSNNYNVDILTDNFNWGINYELDNRASIHTITFKPSKSLSSKVSSLLKTSFQIRKIVNSIKPDIIISVQANAYIRTLIGLLGIRIPIIVSDHTSFARKIDFLTDYTRQHLYKSADAITVLTKKDQCILGDKYPQKVQIYNPISFKIAEINNSFREKTILAVGRYDVWEIKGFDLLFDMWKQIESLFPEWKLQIAGSGTEKETLDVMGLIKERNLTGRVELLGQVKDMENLYSKAGLFVLSSRMEGMPMALLEAMTQGCPSVSFSIGGLAEEMFGGTGGVVVADGDVAMLKDASVDLINNEDKRKYYSDNGIETVKKFSKEAFWESWRELLNRFEK